MNYAFGINAYQGEETALRDCLSYLRKVYPDAPVLVICDGVSEDPFTFVKDDFNCHLSSGPRLRPHPTGGKWLHRLFSHLLGFHVDYLVKLDPDTRILKAFETIPSSDLFGYFRMRTDSRKLPIVQDNFITAAFVAVRYDAARALVASGELLRDSYKDDFYSYSAHGLKRDSEDLSIGSWILNDAARRLGFTLGNSEEIFLMWRDSVPVHLWQKYAVVNVESYFERKQS